MVVKTLEQIDLGGQKVVHVANGTAADDAAAFGQIPTSLALTPIFRTTAYTASANDFVEADATAGGFTVTLPAAPASGAAVTVKKTDTSLNVITVLATGKTIDGDANATLISAQAGGTFVYDGTNWKVESITIATTGPAGQNSVITVVPPITYNSGTSTVGITVGTSSGTVAAGDDSRVIGAIQAAIGTAKGDQIGFTASGAPVRHAVGANNTVKIADSAQADGWKWAAVPKIASARAYARIAWR